MSGFLFHQVVFGPVRSRRLGLSLGINLLPLHSKYCSFNCIYCECGWTPLNQQEKGELPSRELVAGALEARLKELAEEDLLPDSITYAGNGEPTIHPGFPGIVADTLALRDKYAPTAKVTVLSNSSMLDDPAVFRALLSLDNNIQKLDAGSERVFRLINNPVVPVDYGKIIDNLAAFNGKVILQSMFLRGEYRGEVIDNTTSEEVAAWIGQLERIRPASVMIYPIDRATPVRNIEKISPAELEKIAEQVRATGIPVTIHS